MTKGIKTKVSFWATKCGYTWENRKSKILNNKIIKIEDNLGELRDWLINNFSDIKDKSVKKRGQKG